MPVRIELDGAARCVDTLDAAGRRLSRLERAPGQASAIVVAAARSRAPTATGRLRSSIVAAPSEGNAVVVARAEYAAPVHWGVPARHISGRPFLTEAAEATEPVWAESYRAELEQVAGTVRGV